MIDQIRKLPANEIVNMLGVNVGFLTADTLIEYIVDTIETGERIIMAYVNIHTVNIAQKLPWFRQYLNQDAVTYCDGYGVNLGARILGHSFRERHTPPDWFPQLIKTCAERGYRIFLLGAREGIAEKAAEHLSRTYPGGCIIGTQHGYFDKSRGSLENNAIIKRINDLDVDILVLGLGMPAQERWLLENWSDLDCRVALPVGAAIDYLAGELPRAPSWMTDHGFEWLGRLYFEPKRLWKRYLIGIPWFYYRILLQRLDN